MGTPKSKRKMQPSRIPVPMSSAVGHSPQKSVMQLSMMKLKEEEVQMKSTRQAAITFANIPEPMELMLAFATNDFRLIDTLRATSKGLRAMIDHAPALQLLLHRAPDFENNFRVLEMFPNGEESFWKEFHPGMLPELSFRIYTTPSFKIKHPLSEFRRNMFVSQPPITQLEWVTFCSFHRSADHTLNVATGITVGHLHDTVQKYLEDSHETLVKAQEKYIFYTGRFESLESEIHFTTCDHAK